jgi:hypothetical protein
MCLDLRRSALLVWSCARARALQQQTQLEWQPYRDSKVLNAIYSVLFWKEGPGTVEIRQDQAKVNRLTMQFFDQTFDSFLDKSTHGPVALTHYVQGLVNIRAFALRSVQEMFREAASINSEIAGETRKTIETLAQIKLASALVLTGTGCYLALSGASIVLVAQAGLVKLGSDVTGEVIKSHDHIDENVKGVAYQLGKFGAEKGSDKLAEHAGHLGEHGLKEYGGKLVSAEQRIERYSAALASKIKAGKRAKAAGRLNNAVADQAIAQGGLKTASKTLKAAKFAGKGIPLVFAAWDVIDAMKEYLEDTAE